MNGANKALEPVVSTSTPDTELRNVAAEKICPVVNVEEQQTEVRGLRLERCEPTESTFRESVIEKENRFLRANILLHIENERRRLYKQQQQQQKWEANQINKRDPPDARVDSVRLPSVHLLRAVREVFAPGRVVLDEDINKGSSVTIEYSVDHIIVRGAQENRMVFMQSLLHVVLAHFETALSSAMDGSSFPSRSFSQRVQNDSNVGEKEDDEKTGDALIRALRRALHEERVARERAEIAQRDAEHSKAIAEAALRSERSRLEIAKAEPVQAVSPSRSVSCGPDTSIPRAAAECVGGGAAGPLRHELLLLEARGEALRLRERLDAAGAAATALCRGALAHFERRSLGGGGAGRERETEAMVRRVRGGLPGAHAAAIGLSERLADVTALIAAERRELRAAVEFAQNERDAVLSAQKEAKPPSPGADTRRRDTCGHLRTVESAKGTPASCQDCGVLRQELHRCFGEMRRLRDALQAAGAAQVTLQREAKEHAQRASDAAEALRCAEQRHTREFIAARQREEALERQMHLIRASTRQVPLPSPGQVQRNVSGILPTKTAHTVLSHTVGTKSATADFLVTTPSRLTSSNNSIDQGCSSSVLCKGSFVQDLDAIYSK